MRLDIPKSFNVQYHIHYQMNPEKVTKTGHDYAAVLKKKIDVMDY